MTQEKKLTEAKTAADSGQTAAEKQSVRATIKRLRRELAPEHKKELDRAILGNLLTLPEFHPQQPVPIYCYVSIGGEVDTLALMEYLWLHQIPVAVPRVEGNRIRFYRIDGIEDLEPGCMGIPEPKSGCVLEASPESVVLTPGLAFTPEGERIGYGGGFYDRFFMTEPQHVRIAVAYPFQILPALPTKDCDRRVQRIVTGERIYHCWEALQREQEGEVWN